MYAEEETEVEIYHRELNAKLSNFDSLPPLAQQEVLELTRDSHIQEKQTYIGNQSAITILLLIITLYDFVLNNGVHFYRHMGVVHSVLIISSWLTLVLLSRAVYNIDYKGLVLHVDRLATFHTWTIVMMYFYLYLTLSLFASSLYLILIQPDPTLPLDATFVEMIITSQTLHGRMLLLVGGIFYGVGLYRTLMKLDSLIELLTQPDKHYHRD